jgi:hypothetical protein
MTRVGHTPSCHCEERSDVAIRIPIPLVRRLPHQPAGWFAMTLGDCNDGGGASFFCHCEERSDVAIRTPITLVREIATPVCGLVRNDIGIRTTQSLPLQKEAGVQPRTTQSLPLHKGAFFASLPKPSRHCEERSDVAIRIPITLVREIATPVCGLVRNDKGVVAMTN